MRSPTGRLAVLLAVGMILAPGTALAQQKSSMGRAMDYGPCLSSSVTFVKPKSSNEAGWEGAVTRALTVRLPGKNVICYDLDRLAVAGTWQGDFLDRSQTHHTSYKGGLPPRPGAATVYENWKDAGWAGGADRARIHYRGHYLHGENVILSYRIGERDVLEMPVAGTAAAVGRSLQIGPGREKLSLLVAGLEGGKAEATGAAGRIEGKGEPVLAAVRPVGGVALRAEAGRLYLDVPPAKAPLRFTVWLAGAGTRADALEKLAAAPGEDLGPRLEGSPTRWTEVFTTTGLRGPDSGPYTVDELPLPQDPYGSWMRPSALGCFDDGRVALATLGGDVWLVSWEEDLSKVHWQRFATGLYEPMGLKVVGGKVYVRGRDRITRLHDLNGDGEADFYESFHAAGPVGPGYHAFLFELVTDERGNFYYANSGRKAPSKGEVYRVSPDGARSELVCSHFRHPNGMGAGGPHGWITIADNPEGKFPSGASIVREGKKYGWGGACEEPMLYVLPPTVDSSAGSQCWTDPGRWGPLGGTLVHTSFSHCGISYVMPQNVEPHPNGFAVQMPFRFSSGVMRACVSPADGQLYLAGQRGWDTAAAADGCLARVRYTGKPAHLVTGAAATKEGVRLTFSCPLDPKSVNVDTFAAERYLGQKNLPSEELEVTDVKLLDERTALVQIREPWRVEASPNVVRPVSILFSIKARDGARIRDTVHCTVNTIPGG